jgi:2-octaprenyl-6-methoxyphenol hydroxylase
VNTFDVMIVGGALTGSTLALALIKQQPHLRVGLIEKNLPKAAQSAFDSRCVALSAGSVCHLKDWGLWPLFAHAAAPIRSIHVSDQGHFGLLRFTPETTGVKAMGQVISLAQTGEALHQALQASQVACFAPDALLDLQPDAQGYHVTLDSGIKCRTKLVIAADGLHSRVRSQLGLPIEQHDFHQFGYVFNIRTALAHQNCAFERFTAEGPLAVLPMQDPYTSSVVWSLSNPQRMAEHQPDLEAFRAQLQTVLGYRLGEVQDHTLPKVYPLISAHMPRFVGHRCLFMGNAAQMLHPIAGQGFNLGLRDIADWLLLIKNKTENADDYGKWSLLNRYAQDRRRDKMKILTVTESLVRCFSNQHPLWIQGRTLGMSLLGMSLHWQKRLAQQAMALNKAPLRYL